MVASGTNCSVLTFAAYSLAYFKGKCALFDLNFARNFGRQAVRVAVRITVRIGFARLATALVTFVKKTRRSAGSWVVVMLVVVAVG